MQLQHKKLNLAVIAALAAGPCCFITPTLAQDGELEEIMITATRRQTDVQDVPLAVTAITG